MTLVPPDGYSPQAIKECIDYEPKSADNPYVLTNFCKLLSLNYYRPDAFSMYSKHQCRLKLSYLVLKSGQTSLLLTVSEWILLDIFLGCGWYLEVKSTSFSERIYVDIGTKYTHYLYRKGNKTGLNSPPGILCRSKIWKGMKVLQADSIILGMYQKIVENSSN